MVCMLHVLGHGGILKATTNGSKDIAWFFEIAAFCAVNCFGLISGYVGCMSTFRPRNVFRLWLQALYYNFGITLVFLFILPDSFGLKEIVKSFFPMSIDPYHSYWYLTAYVIMYFFVPQMVFLLRNQPVERLRRFLWFFFIIFSILETIPVLRRITSPVSAGYSALWLAYLFMLGGGYPFIRHKRTAAGQSDNKENGRIQVHRAFFSFLRLYSLYYDDLCFS